MPALALSHSMPARLLFALLALSLCLGICSAAHVLTSNQRLAFLASFERAVIAAAREEADSLPQQFQNFVSAAAAEYARHGDSASAYVAFPVSQYRLVSRFVCAWPAWTKELRRRADGADPASSRFLSRLSALSRSHQGIDDVSEKDLWLAGHALTLLQLSYREEAHLLPSGHADGRPSLTAFEMLDLADVTFTADLEFYSRTAARLWVKAALDQVASYRPYCDQTCRVQYILDHADQYGRPPSDGLAKICERTSALEKIGEEMVKAPYALEDLNSMVDGERDITICRHSVDQSNTSLYCFSFLSTLSPYAPFKFEILSHRPYVAVIHNFMPETIAAAFVRHSSLERTNVAGVLSANGTTIQSILVRMSETSDVDFDEKLSRWLDLRIRQATLLKPNSQDNGPPDGEQAQTVNYGLGGGYRPHYDYFDATHQNSPVSQCHELGNRLATVLVYLSDVASGGNTAFPEVGLSVVPRAGKALVWFNLDPRTGVVDNLTLHTACPVNVGSKWVLTKWIRDHKRTGQSWPIYSSF